MESHQWCHLIGYHHLVLLVGRSCLSYRLYPMIDSWRKWWCRHQLWKAKGRTWPSKRHPCMFGDSIYRESSVLQEHQTGLSFWNAECSAFFVVWKIDYAFVVIWMIYLDPLISTLNFKNKLNSSLKINHHCNFEYILVFWYE